MTVLQALREKKGWTREALSARCLAASDRVTARCVYGIEVEGRRPHRATVNALAAALDCPVELLLLQNDRDPDASRAGVKGDADEPRARD